MNEELELTLLCFLGLGSGPCFRACQVFLEQHTHTGVCKFPQVDKNKCTRRRDKKGRHALYTPLAPKIPVRHHRRGGGCRRKMAVGECMLLLGSSEYFTSVLDIEVYNIENLAFLFRFYCFVNSNLLVTQQASTNLYLNSQSLIILVFTNKTIKLLSGYSYRFHSRLCLTNW